MVSLVPSADDNDVRVWILELEISEMLDRRNYLTSLLSVLFWTLVL